MPPCVVGDQRVADLAELHVGHAAGEQLGQEDGRPGPLEPQPAHVRDVGDRRTADRVARCSSMIDVYWTGMAQPAKSTIRAPWATCQSYKGV